MNDDNAKGRVTAETNALAVITRRYDAQGRDAGYDLEIPGYAANVFSVRYGYDGDGLFSCVTSSYASAAHVFSYTRLPETAAVTGYMASDFAESFTFRSTRTYEPNRNLIATVSNVWGAAAVSSFAYTNDALGRRTRRVDSGGTGVPPVVSTNYFCYNARSEVTNAAMGDADYSYEFDDIGNRERAAADAALTVYAANALNQYTLISNSVSSVVNPVYDLDGNMLTNGVWSYTWDAENRMVSAVSEGATVVSNAYDYLSRRVRKEVYAWDSQLTAYRLQSTASYVWDGWNIAAEIVVDSVAACTNVHFYTWGLDLSGSLQGAGGVGGLLADTRVSSDTSYLSPLTYYPTYDANGNVTEYVDVTGAVRARYAYSAFGETTSQSCDMAGAFTHRFSTKPFDTETGVSKYQLRDYLPGLGRWASRDPIGVEGGVNEYGFINNDSLVNSDYLGQRRQSLFKKITVPKCNITLFIGHQYFDTRTITWVFPDKNVCAYGGDIGCMPGYNMPRIESAIWPGQYEHLESIFNFTKASGLNKSVAYRDVYSKADSGGGLDMERNPEEMLKLMYSSSRFIQMYKTLSEKPCCCKYVTVNVIIGEELEGEEKKKEIANLVRPYSTWRPGHTRKYSVNLEKVVF